MQDVLDDHADLIRRFKPTGGQPDLRQAITQLFEAAQRDGMEQRLLAEQTAIHLYECFAGSLSVRPLAAVFAKRGELVKVLSSLQPEMRGLVNQIYQERYGETLQHAAKSVLRGIALHQVTAMLEGNDLSAAIDGIYIAWKRLHWHHSPQRFLSELDTALRPVSRYERRAIERLFEERFGEQCGGRSLEDLLEQKLRGAALERGRALLNGSFAMADALALHSMRQRWSKPDCAMAALLEARTPLDLQRVQAAYRDRYDVSLVSVLERTLRPGGPRDLVLALLAADKDRATAARLRCGVEKVPGYWLGKAFLGKSDPHRQELIATYQRVYPNHSLRAEVDARFEGRELEIVQDLIRDGRVAWGKLFYFCMEGIVPDETGLRSLLHDATPDRIAEAQHEFETIWRARAPWYERLFPRAFGRFQNRLRWVGGDTWFDLRELTAGKPETADEYHEQMKRSYRHERTGWLLRALRFFSREGVVYHRDLIETARLVRDLKKAAAADPCHAAAHEPQLRLEFLVRLEELDCAAIRRLKHFVGDTITNSVAGAVVGISALVFPTLHPHLLPVMGAIAAVSVLVRNRLKTLLKGEGYRWGEKAADTVIGVFDGATLYIPQLIQQMLLTSMTNTAAKLGLKSGLNSLGRMVTKPRTGSFGITTKELAFEEDGEEPRDDLTRHGGLVLHQGSYTNPRDQQFAEIMEEIWRSGERAA